MENLPIIKLDGVPDGARVVVAMSGGVDSSVTAGLLAAAGYEVVGITLQLYDYGQAVQKKGACCAGQDIYDARMVADRLGIPHYVLDYENTFKHKVMDAFAESYLQGETPIPCVLCNQQVKFADLLKFATDLGAVAMATGHYIRRVAGPDGPELHRASDQGKDQSYFLFTTTPAQLAFTHFPLGHLTKPQIREFAASMGLEVASKPDSQDICFVPNGDYASVVARLRPEAHEPGEIVDMAGNVLGQHQGLIHFTVGQRRGLNLGLRGGEQNDPLYVVRLEAATRRVVVGPERALGQQTVWLRDLNWLGPNVPPEGLAVQVKLRSAMAPVAARVFAPDFSGDGAGRTRLLLDEPARAVAPGQAGVIYDGTRVLGGGWIMREVAQNQPNLAAPCAPVASATSNHHAA